MKRIFLTNNFLNQQSKGSLWFFLPFHSCVYILPYNWRIDTFVFFRKSSFYNFWNILFPCYRALSKHRKGLEKTFTTLALILNEPLSIEFILCDFNVSFRVVLLVWLLLHFVLAPYGWKMFLYYFITRCHSEFCMHMMLW